jgi:PhnB protein
MPVQPYLFFDGRCEEAIDLYRKALGAEVEMLMRYKEAPDPPRPGAHEGYEDKIMHANLRIGDGSVLKPD